MIDWKIEFVSRGPVYRPQVELTKVSPYHLEGGVERDSIFFGRKHLIVTQTINA